VRTALFNYLFAKVSGGAFILRLEDTDRSRFDAAYIQNLYDTFAWLGLHWDEGPDIGGLYAPYTQSERLALYRQHALELIDKDKAYYCFCSPERLEAVRTERNATHSSETGYDRYCRAIKREDAARRVADGEPCVIRLKIPLDDTTCFHDQLLGTIEWQNNDISSDPVLLKSDGFPTYHLANVVDDYLMGITHVLRAQEWLPSTPLHVILYQSFGWNPPAFCHLPMVMGQDGKKLSKRHGATSVDEFRRQGYLPEALINYVALLGASYTEGKDLYTLEELEARFSLEKLNKAPAIFDYKKLEWYNGQYIRMKSDDDLIALALSHAIDAGLFGQPNAAPDEAQRRAFTEAIPLIKERVSFLHEIPVKLRYLFVEPPLPEASEFLPKAMDIAKTIELLELGRELLEPLASRNDVDAEAFIKAYAESHCVKLGNLMMPLRVALTGVRVSPPLFGTVRILGVPTSLARVERALAALRKANLNH
jgi:glutamyl-tRNA synthetase